MSKEHYPENALEMAFNAEALTLKEWGAELARHAARVGLKCFCGSALYGGTVEGYDHDGGLAVKGFKENQWVYLTCMKCGHQWSFQHILNAK